MSRPAGARSRRVLLTGATGFLGSWVAEALTALGDHVTTFSGRRLADGSAATGRAVRQAADGADVVCHLAAATPLQPGPPTPAAYTRGNIEATRALLAAAADTSRCPVVLGSTVMIGGLSTATAGSASGRVAYARSKLSAEELVSRYSDGIAPSVSLRFSSLGGPRMQPGRGVISAALDAAAEGRPLPVYGGPSSGRDYLHVLDAAHAVIAATRRRDAPYRVFDVGSGRLSTIAAIVTAVERVTGRPVTRQYLPSRPDVDERPACDPRPAQEALGWAPDRSDLITIVADQWAERQDPGGFSASLRWYPQPLPRGSR